MSTNQGGKVYICATPQPVQLNLAAYKALTWVQIKNVGNVGETGTQTNQVNYDTWDRSVLLKGKGNSDGGNPTLEVKRTPDDPGQVILRAVALTNLDYAVKIERNDAPDGGTPTLEFNRGIVSGPTKPNGRSEDFILEVYTFGFQELEIVEDAAA